MKKSDNRLPRGYEEEFFSRDGRPLHPYRPSSRGGDIPWNLLGKDMVEDPHDKSVVSRVERRFFQVFGSLLLLGGLVAGAASIKKVPTINAHATTTALDLSPDVQPSALQIGMQLSKKGYKTQWSGDFLQKVDIQPTEAGFVVTTKFPGDVITFSSHPATFFAPVQGEPQTEIAVSFADLQHETVILLRPKKSGWRTVSQDYMRIVRMKN